MDPGDVKQIIEILHAAPQVAVAALCILFALDARKERKVAHAKQLADKDSEHAQQLADKNATITKLETLVIRVVTSIESGTAEHRRLVETIKEHNQRQLALLQERDS